ncbi:MAG: Protein UmuD [Chlamydiae bacterium]|nr:Protein UmuD [Chlamydiota bacterium]
MKISNIYSLNINTKLDLPLFTTPISAGFPSPAESHVDRKIDLNQELIKNPAATFFVRVEGDSMLEAGILSGDVLVVDRSIQAKDGKIIVAVVNGEFTVKKIKKINNKYFLVPENKKYSRTEITKEMEFSIWGVVLHAIHSF